MTFVEELTFPVPVELATLVIDPNTPEGVVTVMVELYMI
jgi:hypothetical protein